MAQARSGAWAPATVAWQAEVQFERQLMAQVRVLVAQPISWAPFLLSFCRGWRGTKVLLESHSRIYPGLSGFSSQSGGIGPQLIGTPTGSFSKSTSHVPEHSFVWLNTRKRGVPLPFGPVPSVQKPTVRLLAKRSYCSGSNARTRFAATRMPVVRQTLQNLSISFSPLPSVTRRQAWSNMLAQQRSPDRGDAPPEPYDVVVSEASLSPPGSTKQPLSWASLWVRIFASSDSSAWENDMALVESSC